MRPLTKHLAASVLALATSLSAFAADPVKIGLVLPMSGPFAADNCREIENEVPRLRS